LEIIMKKPLLLFLLFLATLCGCSGEKTLLDGNGNVAMGEVAVLA
jgi:hypothetical protein